MSHRRARLSLVAAVVAAGVVVPAVAPGVAGAAPGAAVPGVTLVTGDKVLLAGPDGVTVRAAKGLYHVRHTEQGSVPRTLRWSYQTRQLAKVRSAHASVTPGLVGVRDAFLPIELPTTLTEYYTPDVPWYSEFLEMASLDDWALTRLASDEPRIFPLGRTTTECWNVGVYGPAFPNGDYFYRPFAARVEDEVRFELPLATDQGRGRAGFADAAVGSTALSRDGQVIAETAVPGSVPSTSSPSAPSTPCARRRPVPACDCPPRSTRSGPSPQVMSRNRSTCRCWRCGSRPTSTSTTRRRPASGSRSRPRGAQRKRRGRPGVDTGRGGVLRRRRDVAGRDGAACWHRVEGGGRPPGRCEVRVAAVEHRRSGREHPAPDDHQGVRAGLSADAPIGPLRT